MKLSDFKRKGLKGLLNQFLSWSDGFLVPSTFYLHEHSLGDNCFLIFNSYFIIIKKLNTNAKLYILETQINKLKIKLANINILTKSHIICNWHALCSQEMNNWFIISFTKSLIICHTFTNN